MNSQSPMPELRKINANSLVVEHDKPRGALVFPMQSRRMLRDLLAI
jgi:hypothetical protein